MVQVKSKELQQVSDGEADMRLVIGEREVITTSNHSLFSSTFCTVRHQGVLRPLLPISDSAKRQMPED